MENKRPRILFVEDEPDLRELMALFIESNIAIDYKEAGSGNQAVEILSKEVFDIVMCDFNMPNGNGKVVFEYVSKMASNKPKFVLVTSDEKSEHKDITEHADGGYLQKPFDEKNLLDVLYAKLAINNEVKEQEYLPMGIRSVRKYGPFPFEIFVRLGKDHYVKIFNVDHNFTSADDDKLKTKGITELFVKREDLKSFLELIQRKAFESLVLPENGLNHSFELADVHQDLVKMGLKGVISNSDLLVVTEKNLKTVFAVTEKVHVLKDLLSWVESEDVSAARSHSIVLSLFCNMVVKGAKLDIPEAKAALILSYASVLHDVGLEDYFIRNEWRITQGIKTQSSMNKSEKAVLGSHVSETKKAVLEWPNCPLDVIEMIEVHHEWPNGTGFPNGKKGDQISPLAALFLVAHEAASMVFEHKTQESLIEALEKLKPDFKPYPHFIEPLQSLITNLTKKQG